MVHCIRTENTVCTQYYLCYTSNGEMKNCSRVPLNIFTKHFAKTSSKNLARVSLIKLSPLKGGVDLIIYILSSKWLDTEGLNPAIILIILFYYNQFFKTKCASNVHLLTQHYYSCGPFARSVAISNFTVL